MTCFYWKNSYNTGKCKSLLIHLNPYTHKTHMYIYTSLLRGSTVINFVFFFPILSLHDYIAVYVPIIFIVF